ncbi:hypothetical protein [Streptomyces sp. NPDC059786]|uniref:LtfC-like domain-containing protein n=1 Tax=Streptomyces sp. NPDC059786 TaxID=3346946 RepID=UPI0036532A95
MAVATFTADPDLTETETATTISYASATLDAQPALALAAFTVAAADTTSDLAEGVAGMAAGLLDLFIEQGATFAQSYTVIDDDAFTWDGWTAAAQIRSSASSAATLYLDLGPYLTVDGPTISLTIPATQTATLTKNGRWDLEMTLDDTVVRLLQGAVIVSPEVTR